MGLDMYLYARHNKYVSSYFKNEGETVDYPEELTKTFSEYKAENFVDKESWQDRRAITINTDYEVGYWRKANAIHKWFVDNCAEGVDNCQPICVSADKLHALLLLCQQALADKENAGEYLPTQVGFFFGSTEYDEYYFDDLENTVKILTKAIRFIEDRETAKDYNWSIVYRASW